MLIIYVYSNFLQASYVQTLVHYSQEIGCDVCSGTDASEGSSTLPEESVEVGRTGT